MGERKVLNRYIPPDFDPSIMPKYLSHRGSKVYTYVTVDDCLPIIKFPTFNFFLDDGDTYDVTIFLAM